MKKRLTMMGVAIALTLAGCQDPPAKAKKKQSTPPAAAATDTSSATADATSTDAPSAEAEAETAPALPEIEVTYERFVLDNGLTLIVHEDHKTPIVAVNVWYHVGSKNEKPGRTGFAHLFEHLMFQGSENFKGEYFEPFEKVGATDMNGTTNEDRTNYFQNVPTPALDMALWMESDRMGHFKGAITQALLDEQRGVVQNEKRQGLNQPYGKVWEMVPEYTYPKNHPYSWSVIGSMDDLNAATLEDVKEWFAKYYGAANAVIVIAGDITPAEAKAKVEAHFGDIAPGPELERPAPWAAPMKETRRLAVSDRVPQARLYKVWNLPHWGHTQERHLELARRLLADGKNSRLYKRLIYDDQLATDVTMMLGSGEIGSQLWLWASARDGVELSKIEAAIDEELKRLTTDGPSDEELTRAKMQYFSGLAYGLERIGGFGGKSDLLARSEVLGGSADAYQKVDVALREATSDDIKAALAAWVGDGVFIVEVYPEEGFDAAAHPTDTPKRNIAVMEGGPATPPMQKDARERAFAAGTATADRSQLPGAGTPPPLKLPAMQRATLSNGLTVVLAERHEAPVVRMTLSLDAGYASDGQAKHLGTANMTMQMLDEGTAKHTALEINAALESLGASISTGSSLDTSFVSLSTLTASLEPSLALYAEVLLTPAFSTEELERQRKQTLAGIKQEKSNPVRSALRLLGPTLFGADHAYGVPLTGSGTEASVAAMTREDLVAFHKTWLRPDQATLIVVGDVTMEALQPQLEAAFASWKTPADPAPTKLAPDVAHIEASRVFLIDKPGAEQSVIIGGHVAPRRAPETDIPMKVMNGVLGGTFTSRLNMNLREDKHWSYGARSFVWPSRNQQLFVAYSAVQTDKTGPSLVEIQKEIEAILGDRPPVEAEIAKIRDNLTLKLPGQNETTQELLNNITEQIIYELPDDYWAQYVGKVRAMTPEAAVEAAKATLKPGQTTWIVVGDLSKIEAEVRALKIGEVSVIDADGQPIAP